MFVQSHLLLAQTIAHRLNSAGHKQLKLVPFAWGAVYPDFSQQYKHIPHTREGALPVLRDLSGSIRFSDAEKEVSDRPSFTMGVICHFICDIFCQAHNFSRYQPPLRHFLYEMEMDWVALSQLKTIPKNLFVPEKCGLASPATTDLIAEIHDLYVTLPPSFRTDLEFSLVCSQAVLMNLLEAQPHLIKLAA